MLPELTAPFKEPYVPSVICFHVIKFVRQLWLSKEYHKKSALRKKSLFSTFNKVFNKNKNETRNNPWAKGPEITVFI